MLWSNLGNKMKQQDKIITIFGGAGFLGSHIVQELAREGYRLKIITRIPESAYELKTYGTVGQIAAHSCDYSSDESVEEAVKNSFAVINLIGILFQKRKSNFQKAHVEIPEKIASACKKHGIKKLIHVSAMGIDKGQSKIR